MQTFYSLILPGFPEDPVAPINRAPGEVFRQVQLYKGILDLPSWNPFLLGLIILYRVRSIFICRFERDGRLVESS